MSVSSAQHAPLRGDLAVTSVPDVLQMLEGQGADARVRFETEIGHGEVDFAAGMIVRAALADLEGRAALFRLLGIVDGSFDVSYEPIASGASLTSSVAQLVEDRAHRFAEWRRLSEKAPPPWTLISLTERGTEEIARGGLTMEQRLVFGHVDGRRTITDVIAESPLDAVEVLSHLMAGLEGGLVQTIAARPSEPAEPEGAETHYLRKHTVIGLGTSKAAASLSLEPAPQGSSEPPGRGTTEVRRIISIGATSAGSSGSLSSPPQESGEIPLTLARPVQPQTEASKRGRFVGRYELLCPIGRGGMGSVYLGRLTSEGGFRRLFALKLLRRHLLEDSASARRFLEEARLAGHIHHPNVVSVIDAGLYGSQPYLVMDYVEGASFKQLLSSHSHQRRPELIVPIVLECLAGLHAAHTLVDDNGAPIGIVHCDVSPENLLVGVDGVCRLADFGVARSAALGGERETVTRGKPGYLAPEQILGAELDRRADVFSMGVVLYNALTGIRLFDAATAEETMQQVCIRPIEPPSTVGLKPPAALDEVCLRALAREPERRFSSAEEMMNELRRIALREGFLASPTEIAQWVRDSVGRELAQRRLLILDAARAPISAPGLAATVPAGEAGLGPRGGLARREHLVLPNSHSSSPPAGSELRTGGHAPTIALDPEALPSEQENPVPRRKALIVASSLAAIAVLMTLLWPNLVSSLFRMETERLIAPDAKRAPGAPSGSTSAQVAPVTLPPAQSAPPSSATLRPSGTDLAVTPEP